MTAPAPTSRTAESEAGETQTAEVPATPPRSAVKPERAREIGGPAGPEPTRYGDWEVKGRCSDF